MGTNYYLHRNCCDHCGRGAGKPLHIGKSSAGWCFTLHVMPDPGYETDDPIINTLDDWKKLFAEKGARIEDEHGDEVTVEEMLKTITERSWSGTHPVREGNPGPNGLTRHTIDYRYCIGHGEGTWDYCPGEFS